MGGEILRISRIVSDLDRAERFYREALGFRLLERGRSDPRVLLALGLPEDAEEVVLQLGQQHVALVCVPGAVAYPADSRADDLWFQHLAVVVSDMDAAYRRLRDVPGWSSISRDGPQTLPPENGGVRAFKFRDPDGHPLELLWFPSGQGRARWQRPNAGGPCLGIDHSALSIAATRRSTQFYAGIGLHVAGSTLNHGPAQIKLDDVPDVRVRVTSLRPAGGNGPGLELLRYRRRGRIALRLPADDVATDWVTLSADVDAPRALRDPDGHRVVLMGAPACGPAT